MGLDSPRRKISDVKKKFHPFNGGFYVFDRERRLAEEVRR